MDTTFGPKLGQISTIMGHTWDIQEQFTFVCSANQTVRKTEHLKPQICCNLTDI